MSSSVIVNIFNKHKFFAIRFLLILALLNFTSAPFLNAQTRQNEQAKSAQSKDVSVTPFTELLRRPVALRPELVGKHPRLFFTAEDLPHLREKAGNSDKELWQAVLRDIQTLRRSAPDPNDEDLYKSGLDKRKEGSISQYTFAFQIAQTSFAYAIEDDEKYLEAAKKWTLAACAMPLWGYTYNKPNVDLPPAHLLYAVAFAYDVLHDKLTANEKEIIRDKLIKQSRLMYDYFKYKPKKRYSYSQNHTSIPMAGLAIAAYALIDETEEAKDWARLARAVFDRTLETFATDGYFYEGFHYFSFSFRWTIRYLDAHRQATGEDLYPPMREKFAPLKLYAMHSILPDRENVFDFADTGDGSPNRNNESKREKLYGEYDILYRMASVYQDSQAQAVGDFIRTETELETREPMWAFINHDPNLKPAPLEKIPTTVYFSDNDTVFWRSDWTRNATAFAFRASPPEGHHAAQLSAKIPDWRQSTGHAHPDANSFIIWANGKYLTGDTGYTGQKQTADHNTVLVNNRGQEKDGRHEVFKEVPNEKLDKIRIAEVFGNHDYFYARGEAASAYYTDLGVKRFDRHFLFVAPDYFIVWDELAAEKPSEFSFLLNADREIKLSGNSADLINKDAVLRVIRVLPGDAKSEVAPQMVLARGLPGSVEKGESKQRGMQLITGTTDKKTENEFLHFLQISSVADNMPAPRVSALKDAKGVRIDWANGEREFVLLQGKSKEIEITGGRGVLRLTKSDAWQRLILQNGTSLKSDGRDLLTSNQTISAVLKISEPNKLNGSIISAAKTTLQLNLPFSPRRLRVNGKVTSFMFDEKTNVLKFAVSEGKNQIEIE